MEIDGDLSFNRRGLCILAICDSVHGCYFKFLQGLFRRKEREVKIAKRRGYHKIGRKFCDKFHLGSGYV